MIPRALIEIASRIAALMFIFGGLYVFGLSVVTLVDWMVR